MEQVVDIAFVIAITAFFKEQFGLVGKATIGVAFLVGVVMWGLPILTTAFPVAAPYINSFLLFLKVWLGAMGTADFGGQLIRKFNPPYSGL